MKRLVAWGTGLIGILLMAGVVAAAEPIRIAYPIWVGFGPIHLAHAKGFFKAQGVDVELSVIDDTKVRDGRAGRQADRRLRGHAQHRAPVRQAREPIQSW